jgi:hypothetical protein
VSLRRAAVVPYFPGCDSGELGVEPTRLSEVFAPYVRLKRDTEGKTGDGATSAQALFGKEPQDGGLQQEC